MNIAEFPFRIDGKSPKSLSEASIAFSNNVFFTTSNLIPALKQAILDKKIPMPTKEKATIRKQIETITAVATKFLR